MIRNPLNFIDLPFPERPYLVEHLLLSLTLLESQVVPYRGGQKRHGKRHDSLRGSETSNPRESEEGNKVDSRGSKYGTVADTSLCVVDFGMISPVLCSGELEFVFTASLLRGTWSACISPPRSGQWSSA
ncbi:hypothetical protein MRB53_040133 [Persea americana]|nr:hypothetical protein MRB53_040133 [Persea americana]